MDQRQKKRIYTFLILAVLAAVLLFTDDLIIRIITVSLIVIYVGFIIFLRDSIRFDMPYSSRDSEPPPDISVKTPEPDPDESFEIVSKNKQVEAMSYGSDFKYPRTTLKPPDLKERFEEIAYEALPAESGPGGQFTFVLERMLAVVKEAFHAYTAVLFWYNKSKEKLSIETYSSDSSEVSQRKFDIEDDILSKIVLKGEPEFLNDISPAAEADVIRYYNTPQGIRSFVGVPLFYDKSLIAIIAIDSKSDDEFGIETIYSLGRFVRVITMIISVFEEKHSDTVAQQRLKGLLNLINVEKHFENDEDLIKSVENCVEHLISWDAFAFVYYNPIEKKFKTTKIVNHTSLKYAGEFLEIDLNGTLAGKAILTGIPLKVDDTSLSTIPRFSRSEDVSFDGSFLAVPLVYNNQNYGVLCFESLKKNAYSNSDIQFLKNSVGMLAFMNYSYSNHKLLKSLIAVDVETRLLNAATFKERLSSDIVKAEQLKIPGALALIRIDDFLEQESLFESNPFPKVLHTITEIISQESAPMNIIGRLDDRIFAIYFFNASTKDVFLWAEKLRVKIARKPISVVSKQTTYTVSIGVASASGKTDAEEILYNADLALRKALEKGGNTVKNIN
jgi:diguanylate cyclase (GGDEF)-like protein